MAADDVEAGRRAWETFATMSVPEELGALAASWDPEVEYVEDPKWPGAMSFRGFEAVGARFREYVDDLGANAELVLEDARDTPEGMVSLVRTRGTSPNRPSVRSPVGLSLPDAGRQSGVVWRLPRSCRGPRRG